MSCQTEIIALRVPCDLIGVRDAWAYCEAHGGEREFETGGDPLFHILYFRPACVPEREYLDYVLFEKAVPRQTGSFARHRAMNAAESRKYLPVFRRLFPDIREADIRYVHYCFYDGGDPPDVYREEETG